MGAEYPAECATLLAYWEYAPPLWVLLRDFLLRDFLLRDFLRFLPPTDAARNGGFKHDLRVI